MTTVLTVKNKIAFNDGKITKPEIKKRQYSPEANAWTIVNSMITSWIIDVINPKLDTSIAYADSAQAIWENIRKRYAVPNIPKIHQLKAEITLCKQGSLKVVEFFSKLMGLWNELGNYVKNPICTCETAAKYAKMAEDDRIHQFLMGLDDGMYTNV